MGQIVGGAAKPKRCNLNKLSQLGTPAAGEYILVSSDNSMNAAGQGNFDCYIVGDGTTAATELELKSTEGLAKKINDILPSGVFTYLDNYTPVTIIPRSICTTSGEIKYRADRCRTDYLDVDIVRRITNNGTTQYYNRFFNANKEYIGSTADTTMTNLSPDENIDVWLNRYPSLAYVIFVCAYDDNTQTDSLFFLNTPTPVITYPLETVFVKEDKIIPQRTLPDNFFNGKLKFIAGSMCYADGSIGDASNRCRSGYLNIYEYSDFDNNGVPYWLRIFDSKKAFLGNGDWTGTSTTKPSIAHIKELFPNAVFVIFACEYTSNTTDVNNLFSAVGADGGRTNGTYVPSVLFEDVFEKKPCRTYIIPTMDYGRLNSTTGYTECLGVDTDYNNYIRTSKLLKRHSVFDYKCDDANASVSIYCYDSCYNFIGIVSGMSNIPQGCSYVKFELYNTNGIDSLAIFHLLATSDAEICDNGKIMTTTYFPFPVKIPYPTDGTTAAFNGYTQKVWDNGCVVLPPNYDPQGKPYQLVICVHGSNGWLNFTGGESVNKTGASSLRCKRFVANDGYIVAGCCGFSSLNKDSSFTIDDALCPVSAACYCGLYEYVCRNYNVRQDGCYIYGKSSGGLMPAFLGSQQPFKIRAIAGLSPVVSNLSDFCRNSDQKTTEYILRTFGYDMTDLESDTEGRPTQAFINSQVEKVTGYEPLLANTRIAIKDVAMRFMGGHFDDVFEDYSKDQPVPIKFWYAVNDIAYIPGQCELYKALVDRGNGICKIRTFPDGGHSAVDSSDSYRCSYLTREGGEITMQTAFAEMLDWFKMW